MVDSHFVKETMRSLGADLCGIASIDRFHDAPICVSMPVL